MIAYYSAIILLIKLNMLRVSHILLFVNISEQLRNKKKNRDKMQSLYNTIITVSTLYCLTFLDYFLSRSSNII